MTEQNTAATPQSQTVTETAPSLLDNILEETQTRSGQDEDGLVREGLSRFVAELVRAPDAQQTTVNRESVDKMIAAIDEKIGHQVDAVLHHKDFQKLESAWRGLKYLVDHTDYREGVRTEILNVSKEDLLDDFRDAPETVQSGLYKHVYVDSIGQFGGVPYGSIIGNYDFDTSNADLELLNQIASVSSMAHVPFTAAASPKLFGKESFEELRKIKELAVHFENPSYAKWNSFRQNENAKYIGLTLPRFMLRTPYSEETGHVKTFRYTEDAAENADNYCWGNASFAFAARLSDSFARYGWCPNIIGPQSGGAVEDLPVYFYERGGNSEAIIPTEVLISDRREYELAEQGFIPLVMRKDSDNASFFSAHSVQKPRKFADTPEGQAAELNERLSTQLPYMYIVSRLSHFLKVMQRENIGSWKNRDDLDRELNEWIRQYRSDMDNPPADVRSRKPLRKAQVEVADFPGRPGWYTVQLSVQPHMKYQGADFTLSLKGKLDAKPAR